jgi:hypothetical protein
VLTTPDWKVRPDDLPDSAAAEGWGGKTNDARAESLTAAKMVPYIDVTVRALFHVPSQTEHGCWWKDILHALTEHC